MLSRDDYDNQTSFTGPEDMALLQELGLNVIHVGVLWAGVEPVQNVYNDTYLSIVEEASMYGLYSLFDMHQDDLSEKRVRGSNGRTIKFRKLPRQRLVPCTRIRTV